MSDSKKIKVRIAPSPTGYLHIGLARSALFNWIFAKKNNGEFILRIDDTDTERSEKKFEEDIISGFKWLGFEFSETYYQSQRKDIYKKYLEKLLKENQAYHCFCSKEDLENIKQSALATGQPPIYNGACRSLSKEEIEKKKNGHSVIRFKVPTIRVKFTDLVRGDIEFDNALLGDIVIAKDLNTPLYNLTTVIDDYEMGITHVIRGEDHIGNTPKQIAIGAALDLPKPRYAHIPLILNPDRSKLSKREGGTSLTEYIKKGYLKEALINFLALLGWHPTGNEELMTIDSIIKEFDMSRVQGGGAVFNTTKLRSFNNHYIRNLDDKDLLELLKPYINEGWLEKEAILLKVIRIIKERLGTLSEFYEQAEPFFNLPAYNAKLLIWKESTTGEIQENLKTLKEIIEKDEDVMKFADDKGRGEVLWPLRVALSGLDKSPGPLEILDILGKEESLKRINDAIEKLDAPEQTY